jgi:hypothetical protein
MGTPGGSELMPVEAPGGMGVGPRDSPPEDRSARSGRSGRSLRSPGAGGPKLEGQACAGLVPVRGSRAGSAGRAVLGSLERDSGVGAALGAASKAGDFSRAARAGAGSGASAASAALVRFFLTGASASSGALRVEERVEDALAM